MRGKSIQHPRRLVARFFDETRGEKGAATTEWSADRRVRTNNAITRPPQNTLCRARVLRLEVAVERVDQQNDLAAGAGGAPAIGTGRPLRQFAASAEPQSPFPEPGKGRNAVSRVHQWRNARRVGSVSWQV